MHAIEYFEDDDLVITNASPTSAGEKPFSKNRREKVEKISTSYWGSDPQGTAEVLATPEEQLGSSVALTTELLAEWEGYVTKVGADFFEARITGIFGRGVEGETEEAVIPAAELSDANKALCQVGALFRLCVSYEKSESGQVRRFTEMVFRRLPAYRDQDLDAARERARVRVNGFRLE